ncbi:LuxR C-terminal-related transcriptional regulator [Streptomyces sp. NPDC055607]
MITVAVVEDDAWTVKTLRRMFEGFTDEAELIDVRTDVNELLGHHDTPPDVVLLDVMLPGPSRQLIPNVRRLRSWGTRVLAVSSQPDRPEVAKAVSELRLNFLPKSDLTSEALLGAIRATAAGEILLSPKMAQSIIWTNKRTPRLTEREKQVMKLLSSGMAPKAVARRLAVGDDTIRKHLLRIRDKYGDVGRDIGNPVLLHYAALDDEIISDPEEGMRGFVGDDEGPSEGDEEI